MAEINTPLARWHRLALYASTSAVVMGLAACGGSDASAESASPQLDSSAPTVSAAAATWTRVARERETFTAHTGRVYRYGSGTTWIERSNLTGSVSCTNALFGSDPLPGVYKQCDVRSASTPAPAPVARRDLGQHPFAATSPWNMPIGGDARFESQDGARTVSLLAGTKAGINRDQWSVAVFQATASDPIATIVGLRNGATVTGLVPRGAGPTGGDDRHVTVIQPDRRVAFDVFKWDSYVGSTVTTQIVRQIDLSGTGIRMGGRAARVPSIAGLIRAEELRRGSIPHALALAVPGSVLKSGPVWPATQQDSDHATSYTGEVPMGTLFAIPGSVDINRLGLSTQEGLALARALQNYGAYVVDRAGFNVLYCELSCDTTAYEALRVAWRTLMPQLRAVTNNTEATVGGGGTPRVPLAPEVP